MESLDSKHSLIIKIIFWKQVHILYIYGTKTRDVFFFKAFIPDTLRSRLSIIRFRQKLWSMFYFPRSSHNEINNLSINESLIIMNKLKWYRNVCENKIPYVSLRIANMCLNKLSEKKKTVFQWYNCVNILIKIISCYTLVHLDFLVSIFKCKLSH